MNNDMSVFMAPTPKLDPKYSSYMGMSAMNTDMSRLRPAPPAPPGLPGPPPPSMPG